MMRKLGPADREKMLEVLNQKAAANLFIIGDLEMFGFDDAIQSFYGEEKDGKFIAIIMRFKNMSLCAYATEEVTDSFVATVAQLIEEYQPIHINVEGQTYTYLAGKLDPYLAEKERTTLAVYAPKEHAIDTSIVEALTSTHAKQILVIHEEAFGKERKGTLEEAVVEFAEKMDAKHERLYGVVEAGEVLSLGAVAAETTNHAMIIGVATPEKYRKQGYATKVVQKICDILLEEGKHAVLFYTNPVAAKIYLELGFIPTDDFYMLKVKEK